MSRLIVVSNRVGKPSSDRAMSGGLAVGISQALAERGGIWFGWNGERTDNPVPELTTIQQGKITYLTQPLTEHDYRNYYLGFSNRVLWPLLHSRTDLVQDDPGFYASYDTVNRRFARQLQSIIEPDDLIWVHDYHLIPLAAHLRKLGVSNRIGFFLHTPFPGIKMLRSTQHHGLLLSQLADYDLIGTQTDADADALLAAVTQMPEVQDAGAGLLRRGPRICAVEALPIGIDVANIQALSARRERLREVEHIKTSVGGARCIIGADRLDYSKGIPERLRGYMHYLTRYRPQHPTALVQIAQPTREDVPEYNSVQVESRLLVEEFNEGLGKHPDNKLLFLQRGFPRDVVIQLLASSDIGLITPLHDGMNLVAKEFVASQNPDNPGVLILSEGAGAARELDSALIVDATSPQDIAAAIHIGLEMPLQERRERWQSQFDTLSNNRIHDWAEAFLNHLDFDSGWYDWTPATAIKTTARRN